MLGKCHSPLQPINDEMNQIFNSSTTLCPLGGGASKGQLKELCQLLWGWKLCTGCTNDQACETPHCPWTRSTKLEPFFQFYQEITSSYVPNMLTNSAPALSSHEDLFCIIRTLKDKYDVPRSILTAEHFSQRGKDFEPHTTDQDRAFNLAIRIMTSVCCSIENQASGRTELGSDPVVWRSDKSLQEFLGSTFAKRFYPTLNSSDGSPPGIRKQLTATKLREVACLRFCGTDDIKNHLRLDQTTGIVEIYHHTSVLKEHLMATQGSGDAQPSEILTSRYE
jgi:hypothetical protein